MQLEKLSVEAFRSLYEVALTPARFTVVVGANNAGKSNLGEAFEFLAEVHRHGLEIAVNRKGGFENVAHRRMRRTKRPLAFDAEATFGLREVPGLRRELLSWRRHVGSSGARRGPDGVARIRHRFEIEAAGQGIRADFAVRHEYFELGVRLEEEPFEAVARVNRDGKGKLTFTQSEGGDQSPSELLLRGFSEEYSGFLSNNLEPTDLLTPSLAVFNFLVREFERNLTAIHLYRLTPLEARKPGAPTPNPDLELHGGNLPAMVAFMQRHKAPAWDQTLKAMRTIVPGLEDIRTGFTHDRRLTLQFVESGVGRPWTAEEISDGTIQSLALFAAVFDPRTPVAFIEEPENAVHPWIVRQFVDACRSVDYKQILVTTHSPALIGYLSPEEVLVVWRSDGRSHVCPMTELDPDAVRLWGEGEVSTFELFDSGWIRQAIPEAYS